MNTLRLSIVALALVAPAAAHGQQTVRLEADPVHNGHSVRLKAEPTDDTALVRLKAEPMYDDGRRIRPYLVVQQNVAPGAPDDRFEDFLDMALLSPGPYVLALGGGVIDQVTEFPEEWTGSKGFGQRTLARVGSGLASDVVGHSLAAVLRHRVRYEPCICSGAWNRTTHALAWGFATRHENGDMVMHTSLFAAKFAAAGIANAWYPRSYTGGDVAREGAVGIGVNALLNIAREFAPELKRLIGIR
jgi:hypothetical protein